MVRDIGYKAEKEVRGRIKLYSWVTVVILGLLALYGVTSIRDAQQKIVNEAKARVEPVVGDVEKRAQAAQTRLADVEKRLPGVTESFEQDGRTGRPATAAYRGAERGRGGEAHQFPSRCGKSRTAQYGLLGEGRRFPEAA